MLRLVGLHPQLLTECGDVRRTMYWAVWGGGGGGGGGGYIERALMDGSQRRVLVAERLHWPAGLALHPERDQLYWCVCPATTTCGISG